MQGKMHDRVVEMRLCFFSGKVGDYKVLFKSTRKCRSTRIIRVYEKGLALKWEVIYTQKTGLSKCVGNVDNDIKG